LNFLLANISSAKDYLSLRNTIIQMAKCSAITCLAVFYITALCLLGLGIYLLVTRNTEYIGFQARIDNIYTNGQKIKIAEFQETTCLQYSCAVVNFTNLAGYVGQCYIFQSDKPDSPVIDYNVMLYREGWYVEYSQPICATDSYTVRNGRRDGGIALVVIMCIAMVFVTMHLLDGGFQRLNSKKPSVNEGSPSNGASQYNHTDLERGNTNEGN
jgi:hypothetical protein